MIKKILTEDSGYTLVETLVAMVIFLSVLIPVGFGAAAYLFDRKAEDLREGLLLAEAQMSTQDYSESGESTHGKYSVKSEIVPIGQLVEYRVSVSRIGRQTRPLVVLTKMVRLAP
jgi:prepilin-type N-terminal cleavage/methylation domain-containing protein